MRIITGTARSVRLKTLAGDNTRPTSERVKEALFSIIQFEIEGRRVLDLFAGSGQLGLEALSRGAKSAVFVDNSKESAGIIKENIAATRLSGARFTECDGISYIKRSADTYDVIFLDPPYSTGLLETALIPACEHLSAGGVIVCEHPKDEPPGEIDGMSVRRYRYGAVALSVYRKEG